MIIGEKNKLKMIRKSDLGFMLSDGKDTVLLHYKEATKELIVDEYVDVFIYLDKEGRTAASMHEPNITISKHGFVSVVDVKDFGVYVSNNCAKDLLISKDNLPYNKELWPQVGDKICGYVKIKGDKMLAKPLNRDEINYIRSEVAYAKDEIVTGYVAKVSEAGVGIVSKEFKWIFVPQKQLRGNYRLGEEVMPKITSKSNSEYYGSLNEVKEKMLDGDCEIIIDYLKKHNGVMALTAKSSADDVFMVFKMSRKAFKRALGSLYKERIVDCLENETKLI